VKRSVVEAMWSARFRRVSSGSYGDGRVLRKNRSLNRLSTPWPEVGAALPATGGLDPHKKPGLLRESSRLFVAASDPIFQAEAVIPAKGGKADGVLILLVEEITDTGVKE